VSHSFFVPKCKLLITDCYQALLDQHVLLQLMKITFLNRMTHLRMSSLPFRVPGGEHCRALVKRLFGRWINPTAHPNMDSLK
jgi:hypothetical protein